MRCVNLALLCLAAACASRSPTETAMKTLMEATSTTRPGRAVALPCDWPVGTTAHYRYERWSQDSRTPGLEQVTSVSPATLTVLGPDRLSFDIGPTELTGPPHLISAAQAMLAGFDLSPMELVLQDGVLVDVANREALMTEVLTMTRAMLPPDTPPEALRMVEGMYADPASATQLLLKEPNILLAGLCTVMGDGERVEQVIEIPGLAGGPNLRSITAIDAELRLDEGTATYTFTTIIDPESLGAAAEHFMKSFTPAEGEAMPPLPLPEHQSVMIAVYSLADGLPVSVDATQTTLVRVGDLETRHEERGRWTRLPAP